MRAPLASWTGFAMALAAGSAGAESPRRDYSGIRCVNYGMNADQAVIERDRGYVRRVNLNSTRDQ